MRDAEVIHWLLRQREKAARLLGASRGDDALAELQTMPLGSAEKEWRHEIGDAEPALLLAPHTYGWPLREESKR